MSNTYQTHKTGQSGRAQTVARRNARMLKYGSPALAAQHKNVSESHKGGRR